MTSLFFGGYERTRIRQVTPDTAFVPAGDAAGDFTAAASPACNAARVKPMAPFVGNRIDPGGSARRR
jgi:hypothetical protein